MLRQPTSGRNAQRKHGEDAGQDVHVTCTSARLVMMHTCASTVYFPLHFVLQLQDCAQHADCCLLIRALLMAAVVVALLMHCRASGQQMPRCYQHQQPAAAMQYCALHLQCGFRAAVPYAMRMIVHTVLPGVQSAACFLICTGCQLWGARHVMDQ